MGVQYILIALAAIGAASLHSREALAIVAGLATTALILVWRYQREASRPETLEGEPLEAAAQTIPEAEVVGQSIRTRVDGRMTAVQVHKAPVRTGGRLPLIRVRILLCAPIPYCFLLRRRASPFAVDAIVSNTPLERPPFEYELHRVEVSGAQRPPYEAASNLPGILRRLLDDHLEDALLDALMAHDVRLEEAQFDGSRLTTFWQPAGDPETDASTERALSRSRDLADAVDGFLSSEGLEVESQESP